MALNPFQRHTRYIQAQQAARSGGTTRHASGYEQMLMQLTEDQHHLKRIQSKEKKAELKRQLLPKYAPWVAGVLAAKSHRQDDVLMHIMVWRIDAGDYTGALALARHALTHDWVMPRPYTRQTACTVAEEFADAAMRAFVAQKDFDADVLMTALTLTDSADMPDESRARLHKALGYALRAASPMQALNHLKRALQLNQNSGVKKDIEQLERQLRNASSAG
ncbi:phage terminase small subunit [Brenneria uluponensis]|uniref:phage terminase small subunit n=1 Tax=Brenneria uluponensis TaxID=3057057 RepID=UPI0028E68DAD|nr:phage terminase small subunit [Brenneria ulupoensis]